MADSTRNIQGDRTHSLAGDKALVEEGSALPKTSAAERALQQLEAELSGIGITARAVRLFFAAIVEAPYGRIKVVTPTGNVVEVSGTQEGAHAEITFHDWRALRLAALRGDIGFGEAHIEGLWSSPDVGLLMTYFVQNLDAMEAVAHGSWLRQKLFGVVNWLRSNTKSQASKNIRAHYDVGNDFYRLWLDETMTYSSALFTHEGMSLAAAQRAKYARMLDAIEKPNAHILEIGCGWGGLAEEAAKRGHRVTCLTLSPKQREFAMARMEEKGLSDLVEIRLQDYRDVQGQFDAVISIEMFEAVGEKYWSTYFEQIRKVLAPDGVAMIQTITVADEAFAAYRKRSDFIRHYTFPGGMLPSLRRLAEVVPNAGLAIAESYGFGRDYAETLRRWADAIAKHDKEIRLLGYDEAFLRSWNFYIGCCVGAFDADRCDVVQLEIRHG